MKLTNLKIYYLLIFTNNLWFITSNWLNFWLKYMSMKEVGIIDAIAFLTGILLEFPSGLISDRLGRKQTLFLSQSFQLLGSLLITLSSNLYEIGLGFTIFQIGVAFYSGTIEAYGFESAEKEGQEYTKVLTLSSVISNFAYLGSLVLGGYLYLNNQNLPNILFTFNFVFGVFIVIFIKNTILKSEKEQDVQDKVKFNFPILFMFIILMTAVFSFDYGFLKLVILEKFSTLESNFWFIFSGTTFSIFLTGYLLPKITNYFKVTLISTIFLISSYLVTFYSYLPLFFTLSFMAVFIFQISLKYINEKVVDGERAGVISLFNLCYKLPYVLIALYLGYNLS